jgi:hypothetical protein
MTLPKLGMALAAGLVGCAFGVASAKLPAPTDEQKSKAAEAKAKADDAAKREAALLGKYQDRAIDNYRRGKVQKTSTNVSRKP